MTDDKGAGDGPYRYELAFIGARGGGWRVVGPDGPYGSILAPENVAIETVKFLNIGYAAGRKAERERCLKEIKND